jgi:hypothetical protein
MKIPLFLSMSYLYVVPTAVQRIPRGIFRMERGCSIFGLGNGNG